jgi:hypothetical protein
MAGRAASRAVAGSSRLVTLQDSGLAAARGAIRPGHGWPGGTPAATGDDMLRLAGTVMLAVHALIHLLGFVKAFRPSALDALTLPIGRLLGLVWLTAALALGVAAAALALGHGRWWLPAAIGVVLSQVAITASWRDAWAGTLVNAVIAAMLVPALADLRPSSNHATYRRRVAEAMARPGGPERIVTDGDLAHLPPLVRGYLARVGAIGRPRVRTVRVRFHGTIRENPASAWMPFTGEQHSILDRPERLFFLRATRAGLPVDGLHAFRADEATMRIRLASLVAVVDIAGGTLVRSETVTFLNDLCLLAPAALIDAPIAWEEAGPRAVRARYTLGHQQVSAVLTFDAAGDLVDFRSDDRRQDAGGADRPVPWTTPVSRFRTFAGGSRLPGYGEGWWHPAEGAFAYLRIELDDITYNVGGP